ncbi:MAG: NfeD family protein [Deltaproteobacteria bacterium]|nr:NfeD family protein [Deltaproteobacteria bacterium]
MQPWIVWTIFAVVLFVAEMLTPGGFYFACIGIGALLAALLSVLTTLWWGPWGIFLAASVILLIVSRPLAHRLTQAGAKPSNVDALVGRRGRVTVAIEPDRGNGMVKIDGDIWRATASEAIPAEHFVEVVAIEGTRAIVKRTD